MEVCNTHYYATRDPLGAQGDFTTAPEISQIFGECIGAFIAHIWMNSSRKEFDLIEGGPGRGTLMADILRATKNISGFHEAANITLLETSPLLREKQFQTLSQVIPVDAEIPVDNDPGFLQNDPNVRWIENIEQVLLNRRSKFMIFNELFDALPIQQFIFNGGTWRERIVNENGELDSRPSDVVLPLSNPQENDIYELSPARLDLMDRICQRLKDDGGMAIIIDYGTDHWGVGDTLQAMCSHEFAPVLKNPGEADLTSHVDFNSLAKIAQKEGLYSHPLMTQGRFLDTLGGRIRAEVVKQHEAYKRLADPDQMGALFKVLIVSHPHLGDDIKGVFK